MNVFVLGLPNSGKTTFLAALWESLTHEGNQLSLTHLPDDRQYFVDIHERWLQCLPALHTPTAQSRGTRLALKQSQGAEVSLQIPDIAGEAFARLWEVREWSMPVLEAARNADAIAIFAHSGMILSGEPIVALREGRPIERTDGEDDAPRIPWNPKDAPTQTKLVDLIQQVAEASNRARLPLTVLISAWDLQAKEHVEPGVFLSLEMPLLWQFLQTSELVGQVRIVGISAQGGSVDDETLADDLRRITPPGNRISVQTPQGTIHDASEPLAWLINAAAPR